MNLTARRPRLGATLGFGAGLALAVVAGAQTLEDRLPLEHPAIQYGSDSLDNPVTWLADRVENGTAELEFRATGAGYLEDLLRELDIDADSQALVYSETGFQTALISRETPRAIYFNDEVAVGFVQGGDLEIMAVDPDKGVAFFTLPARAERTPRFQRQTACLQCHFGPDTGGVPGWLVRSTSVVDTVSADSAPTSIVTDHRTSHERRWRGWLIGDRRAPSPVYPAPTSDLVALMTLEHQSQMANLLVRLNWEARIAKHGGLLGYGLAEAMRPRVEEVLAYMVFAEEAAFPETVEPASTFAETFPRRGPHDRNGRSLREFDLERRLFRYPLSYMIYSRAFDAIEPVVREYLLRRLYDVLIGDDRSAAFAHLSAVDREVILTILRDTMPTLPTYWRSR